MMHPRGFIARNGVNREERRGRGRRDALPFTAVLVLAAMALICWSPVRGQTNTAAGSPLARGIALYQAGKYPESLNELRTVVDSGSRRGRALAYYYAARDRIRMGNLPAARKNLLAAREDSAGFSDAEGLLAWTNLKLGNRTDALIEWRHFVRAVGSPDSGRVTVESIMLPEEYRGKMARAAASRPVPPAASPSSDAVAAPVAKAPQASAPPVIAAATVPDTTAPALADSLGNAPFSAIGKPDSAGTSLANLDQKIQSQIRQGYYGIGAATVLLLAGLAVIAWWMGRRRRAAPRLTFSATVERALDEVDAEEDLGPEEESLAREFEVRSREIREEPPVHTPGPEIRPEPGGSLPRKGYIEPEGRPPIPAAREERSIFPSYESDDRDARSRPAAPSRSAPGAESGRLLITEEVKTLVARMHREGHSVVDIARIADLTRTEVELILAVRARGMEQLIDTVSSEEDDAPDLGALYRAIGELHAEGRPPKETARSLGISVTEVNLALAMMEKKRVRRR